MTTRVVVVDHHDSYTYNLVHLVAGVTGELPPVLEHDEVTAADVLASGVSHVVLSPGPGHPGEPDDFRAGREILRQSRVPVLGVCLGMQGLVLAYGGTVERVDPAHGTVARIRHEGVGVFTGLPQDFAAVRYHSLAATRVPNELEVTAWSDDQVVMGVQHRSLPLHGVQFHPESILTEHGAALVANFLRAEA
jgi:anthranilate synthase/aminodeoxychorismate synthase-like glutamine amidotransferase